MYYQRCDKLNNVKFIERPQLFLLASISFKSEIRINLTKKAAIIPVKNTVVSAIEKEKSKACVVK